MYMYNKNRDTVQISLSLSLFSFSLSFSFLFFSLPQILKMELTAIGMLIGSVGTVDSAVTLGCTGYTALSVSTHELTTPTTCTINHVNDCIVVQYQHMCFSI